MSEVALAAKTQECKESLVKESKEGKLQCADQSHSVTLFENTEDLSSKTFEFLQSLFSPKGENQTLDFEAILITPELVALEEQIEALLQLLKTHEQGGQENKSTESPNPNAVPKSSEHQADIPQMQNNESTQKVNKTAENQEATQTRSSGTEQQPIESVFTLARMTSSFQKNTDTRNRKATESQNRGEKVAKEGIAKQANAAPMLARSSQTDPFKERQRESNKDQQQDQGEEGEEGQKKKKKHPFLQKDKNTYRVDAAAAAANYIPTKRKIEDSPWLVKAATPPKSKARPSTASSRGDSATEGLNNIYIRFMALMARILGQAEASAHDLYRKIKARTDSIDTLTHLLSKINSEKGDIDWSKDEEMKKLIEQVRELGVDIPEGKYKWKKSEISLLKENIQMKKDSMEKVTQLERTDMQRYLQEASQCHQARSNVLKLMKEVGDTIIHNMRP